MKGLKSKPTIWQLFKHTFETHTYLPPCTVGGRERHWGVGFHANPVEFCELFAEVDILRRCSAENVAIFLQALPQLAFNSCLRGWMLDIVQFRY